MYIEMNLDELVKIQTNLRITYTVDRQLIKNKD